MDERAVPMNKAPRVLSRGIKAGMPVASKDQERVKQRKGRQDGLSKGAAEYPTRCPPLLINACHVIMLWRWRLQIGQNEPLYQELHGAPGYTAHAETVKRLE